ncbi:MAG: hypothetical protein HZA70_03050 [Planctomycetes bacterium]|nr:hypothetical protein [Planctomycetota bacterium]
MTYKEPNYETVILLKLGAMEGQLKSFMAGLEEPLLRKKVLATIEAPVSGTIVRWKRTSGWVGFGTHLCTIRATKLYGGGIFWVKSTHEGYLHLHISAGEGYEVSAGETIATIEDTVWI